MLDWRWDIVPASQKSGGYTGKFLAIAANNPLALNGALYDRCVLSASFLGGGGEVWSYDDDDNNSDSDNNDNNSDSDNNDNSDNDNNDSDNKC